MLNCVRDGLKQIDGWKRFGSRWHHNEVQSMSFEFNPEDDDPHGECRHEIHRLKMLVQSARHLLMNAVVKVPGGPTDWTETKDCWIALSNEQ